MAKAQINFRIDPKLLEAIKAEAAKSDMTYTHWVIRACEHCLKNGFVAHGHSLTSTEVDAKIEKLFTLKTASIWQELEDLKKKISMQTAQG